MKRLFVGFAVAFCMFQNAAHAQLGERSATQSQVANSIPAGIAPYTQPLCPTGTAGSATMCALPSVATTVPLTGNGQPGGFQAATGSLVLPGGTTVSGNLNITANNNLNIPCCGSFQADIYTSLATGDSLSIKDGPGGNIMLNIGGGNHDIEPQVPIVLKGWSWATYSNAPITQNASFSGTTSGGTSAFGMFLQQTDNSNNTGNASGITEHLIVSGSSAQGNRIAGNFDIDINQTGNTTGATYVGLTSKCSMNVTDGTGSGSGCNAGNDVAQISAGVTTQGLIGREIDTNSQTGAVIAYRVGLQIVDITASGGYGIQGTTDDVMLSLNNQYAQNATYGYKVGLEFGRYGGNFPLVNSGTMIMGQGANGGSFTVANGIDWHLGTASGNWLNFGGNVIITGAGDALLNSPTALATTATAGFVHFPHSAGTPTGTPTNTTGPACQWNTSSHTLNCYDGAGWYHVTATSGAG